MFAWEATTGNSKRALEKYIIERKRGNYWGRLRDTARLSEEAQRFFLDFSSPVLLFLLTPRDFQTQEALRDKTTADNTMFFSCVKTIVKQIAESKFTSHV